MFGGLGIMPGEHDWLDQILNRGMTTPPIFGGAQPPQMPDVQLPTESAAPPERPGFLGKLDKATAQFGGAMPLGLALLANSGNTGGAGFGEIFGKSALQAQQLNAQSQENELMKRYREAQIRNLDEPNRGATTPASVREYEYAKQNGFKGTFQDWVVAGGQSSRPSSVQEWDFYSQLPEAMQRRYLEMKRNPDIVVRDVNKVPTAIAPSIGFGTQTTPLSTLPAEAAAAEKIKGAEAEGGAVGKARGEVTGGIITKGANARSTINSLDLADPLIDAATGSLAGAGRDRLAAVFGEAPQGAQAIAQLRVLQANLMTSMPRMEGPQSDKDVELYRQAAGQIGDPTVPGPIKKAAVQTIRQLQNKYVERADSLGEGSTAPKRRRYNPQTGRIE